MGFSIEPPACRLMKDQVRHTNGQFFNPHNIIKNADFQKWVDDDKFTLQSIAKGRFVAIPIDEWEKMRYEEQCVVEFHNGKYIKTCEPIENVYNDAIAEGRSPLAGGRPPFGVVIPTGHTSHVYDLHNHPLYRENIPSPQDLTSFALKATDIDPNQLGNYIMCVGELDHLGEPHVFCSRFTPQMQAKIAEIKARYDPLEARLTKEYEEGKITREEGEKKFDWLDAQVELWTADWMSKWKQIVKKEDEFAYVVRRKVEGGHEYQSRAIASNSQRAEMREKAKHLFGDVLEFGEC